MNTIQGSGGIRHYSSSYSSSYQFNQWWNLSLLLITWDISGADELWTGRWSEQLHMNPSVHSDLEYMNTDEIEYKLIYFYFHTPKSKDHFLTYMMLLWKKVTVIIYFFRLRIFHFKIFIYSKYGTKMFMQKLL